MSSVQKILDELHLSRIQLENDKKAGEKARTEYIEFEQKIKTVREKREYCSYQLETVYKSIAVRTTDVTLYAKKLDISKLHIEELKAKIDDHVHGLKLLRDEYSYYSEVILESSVKFASFWNCTESGYEQRKIHRQNAEKALKAKKIQLFDDLDEYLKMQKKINVLKEDLLAADQKYQQREEVIIQKEKELYKEMEKSNDALNAIMEKKQIVSQARKEELEKIVAQIENRKEIISKLEIRVSTAHNIMASQKKTQQFWGAIKTEFKSERRIEQSNTSRIHLQPIQPIQSINSPAVKHHVIPKEEGNLKNSRPIFEDDDDFKISQTQYSSSSGKKGPKVFQFKKKCITPTQSTGIEFVSGKNVYQSRYGQ